MSEPHVFFTPNRPGGRRREMGREGAELTGRGLDAYRLGPVLIRSVMLKASQGGNEATGGFLPQGE